MTNCFYLKLESRKMYQLKVISLCSDMLSGYRIRVTQDWLILKRLYTDYWTTCAVRNTNSTRTTANREVSKSAPDCLCACLWRGVYPDGRPEWLIVSSARLGIRCSAIHMWYVNYIWVTEIWIESKICSQSECSRMCVGQRVATGGYVEAGSVRLTPLPYPT